MNNSNKFVLISSILLIMSIIFYITIPIIGLHKIGNTLDKNFIKVNKNADIIILKLDNKINTNK